jgi:hypothetical protein
MYVQEHQPWDADLLVEQYLTLHSEIEKFFYWALTEKGKEEFGFREDANG